MTAIATETPGETPVLRPLNFIPGCNTPADVTRAHIVENVERDLPWLELEPLKNRPLVIVAGGPSLAYCWPEIESHGGDILALNNAYGFLLERDIEPDYFMMLDARAENVEFLRSPCKTTRHYLAAQCHPDAFDSLEGYDTRLYLTVHPESLPRTEHIDKPKHRIAGHVGTVGIKSLCMAYALGYRELHLYGYDSSYAGKDHHAFVQTLNDNANTIEVVLDGNTYVTTPTMAQQATEFCDLAAGMTRMGFEINLHCAGLLPAMVTSNNALGEIPLEVREREKYESVWSEPAYRRYAPGEKHFEIAAKKLKMKPGQTVIDFGCGCGRGAQGLKDMGFDVTGIDFASNCRDPQVDFKFVQACLWDMPPMHADFGFCTDVMEHIPNEKVEDVIEQIADRCDTAYFNISTVDDCSAWAVGKKLHMSVMNGANWEKVMRQYWFTVEMTEFEAEVRFIVRRPFATKRSLQENLNDHACL